MNIPMKTKINPAAFSGDLICPHPTGKSSCGANKWKFVENISPTRIRYRCKVCNRTIQYDFSNNPLSHHPYEPLKRNHWQKIVEASKRTMRGKPFKV